MYKRGKQRYYELPYIANQRVSDSQVNPVRVLAKLSFIQVQDQYQFRKY